MVVVDRKGEKERQREGPTDRRDRLIGLEIVFRIDKLHDVVNVLRFKKTIGSFSSLILDVCKKEITSHVVIEPRLD